MRIFSFSQEEFEERLKGRVLDEDKGETLEQFPWKTTEDEMLLLKEKVKTSDNVICHGCDKGYCPSIIWALKICNQDIWKTVIAKSFKLSQLVEAYGQTHGWGHSVSQKEFLVLL